MSFFNLLISFSTNFISSITRSKLTVSCFNSSSNWVNSSKALRFTISSCSFISLLKLLISCSSFCNSVSNLIIFVVTSWRDSSIFSSTWTIDVISGRCSILCLHSGQSSPSCKFNMKLFKISFSLLLFNSKNPFSSSSLDIRNSSNCFLATSNFDFFSLSSDWLFSNALNLSTSCVFFKISNFNFPILPSNTFFSSLDSKRISFLIFKLASIVCRKSFL